MDNRQNKKRKEVSRKRNLKRAEEHLDRAADHDRIADSTVQTARMIYKQTLDEQENYLNWSIENTVATSLYVASRVEHSGLTPSSITDVFDISEDVLFRRSKAVVSDLSGAIDISIEDFLGIEEYIEEYCSQLDLPESFEQDALDNLEECRDAGVTYGKSPTGLAAAIIYTTGTQCDLKVTQSDISDVADVSEVTIRNRYQEQEEVLEQSN